MKKDIEKIYEDLFNDYAFFGDYADKSILKRLKTPRLIDIERTTLQAIKNQIEKAEKELPTGIRLRPDAKFFITVIFHQMIALPLLEEGIEETVNNVKDYISEDVSYLISSSLQYKMIEQDSNEISAHTILIIMDRDWNKMNIAKFALWND